MSNESVTIPSSDEQRLALYKKIGVRAFLAVFGIMIVLWSFVLPVLGILYLLQFGK